MTRPSERAPRPGDATQLFTGDGTLDARATPTDDGRAALRHASRAGAGSVAASVDGAIDAYEPRLARVVRLVRSPPGLDSAAADRFLRGARIAGALDHPSVPCVLAIGRDDDDRCYYVLPRRQGTPLAAWCPRAPLGRRIAALIEVARVLAHAHARGVVHGRLGAPAVEVGEVGELRIGGWDDARVAHDSPLVAALGTARDAPPRTVADDLAALADLCRMILGDDPVPELERLAARLAGATPPALPDVIDELVRFQEGARSTELRARAAAAHLGAARRHLAADDREVALVEARRALALDPGCDAAAAIVARVVLEVPDPLPPGASAALATSDQQVIRTMGSAVIAAFAAFLLYVPLMLAQGVRDWTTVVAVTAMTALMLGWAIRWRTVGPHVFSWPAMLGTAMVLTLYARVMGPFVNAPAEATLAVMAVSFFPRAPRAGAVLAVFALPVLGTWALEAAGALPRSTWVEGGALVVRSPVVALSPTDTVVGLVFVSMVVLGVAGALASYLVTSHRHHTRRLVTQAWRIRQVAAPAELVPAASGPIAALAGPRAEAP